MIKNLKKLLKSNNMKNIKINTFLDFLAIVITSAGGMCILEINKGCIDFYLCVFFCLFTLICGLCLIYLKYKIRL